MTATMIGWLNNHYFPAASIADEPDEEAVTEDEEEDIEPLPPSSYDKYPRCSCGSPNLSYKGKKCISCRIGPGR